MPDYSKPPISLQNTKMFKDWLHEKGYFWSEKPWIQENLIAEFNKDGLESIKQKENEQRIL